MSFSSTKKYDYIEVVNRGVPEYYRVTDYTTYGSEEDVSLTFLGKLIKAGIQNELLFDVSGYSKEQVAEFFIPEGKTYVTTNTFQGRFLTPYGLTFDSFSGKSEFKSWLSGTFFPDTLLNNPSGFYAELSAYGFGSYSSLELTHEYLIDNLGLFYFMNTSSLEGAAASSYASAIQIDYLADAIFDGKEATEQEALNAMFRFFWENRENSTFYRSFIPDGYAQNVSAISGNEYLSGTQLYDAVRVQVESWTDKRLKNHDFYKQSLSAVITNTGVFPSKLRDAGPFQRFLKALSLGVADINLILEEIADLVSIDECPERFLELLANNIGWQLLTGDYTKWRAQLRNAVLLYKSKGSVLGFNAACKLIFPDGLFSASSVVETWESYVPKLLYYMVKNNSFIAKENLEFASRDEMFEGAWPEGIRFNQAPENYPNAKDRNHRFLVDSILERFHKAFQGIVVNGENFKKLPIWTCLPDEQPGFYHRNYPNDPSKDTSGFFVAVPPWEKYGFYKETEINPERIAFFCNILSGNRYDGGFEVDEYIVEAFRKLATTAIESTYAVSGVPIYAENNKFRLFTSDHELPPDYLDYIEYGQTGSISDFDVWNTKGSHLFAAFAASGLDYTVDAYDTFKNKAALETYRDVLRSQVPLHAVVRILLYLDLEDTYVPSGTLCVFSDKCLDDFNTGFLNSRRTDFWAGASGTGELSTTYINGDGRILPSYVASENEFWQVSADNLDRNASRRRNYRYALECYPYMRGGKGMPIALNYYNASSSNPYLNTDEYILKGFEYDRQDFVATSSVIWDNSGFYSGVCASEASSGQFDLSTLYPVRGVGEEDFECSSLPVYRDTMKGVLEVMTSRGLQDPDFDFSDINYRSFEFGNSLHESYTIYKNEFSSVLENNEGPNQPYYGGHNFLSHAFGPTLWNSDFKYKGLITEFGEPVRATSAVSPVYDGDALNFTQKPNVSRSKTFTYGNWEYRLITEAVDFSAYDGDIGAGTPTVLSGSLRSFIVARPKNSTFNFNVAGQWTSQGYDKTEICQLWHGNDSCTAGGCFWNIRGADTVYTSPTDGQSDTTYGLTVSSYELDDKNVVISVTSNDGSSLTISSVVTLSSASERSRSRWGYDSQWRKIVAGTDAAGQRYTNVSGVPVAVSKRTYFADAPRASEGDSSGVFYDLVGGDRRLITREYLSGLEIHQPWRQSKSFIVTNNLSATHTSTERSNCITLFTVDDNPLEVVVPFDPATEGSNFYNKLRPQSQQAVDVFSKTQKNAADQVIGVWLVTSGVLQDDGNEREWSYHWPSKKWWPTDMVKDTDEFIYKMDVPLEDECVTPYRAHFHTQDAFTIKSIPCTSTFMSSEVHTSSTGYLLRVMSSKSVDSSVDGLNIYEISVVDKCLNDSMNNFNTSAVDRIYTFWDGLSEGYYSRDAADSSGTFETSGGSRAEYLELVGYEDYSTSSTVVLNRTDYDVLEVDLED